MDGDCEFREDGVELSQEDIPDVDKILLARRRDGTAKIRFENGAKIEYRYNDDTDRVDVATFTADDPDSVWEKYRSVGDDPDGTLLTDLEAYYEIKNGNGSLSDSAVHQDIMR